MTDPIQALAKLRKYAARELPGADEMSDDLRAVLDLLTPGVLQIAVERRRQITDEGYTPEHDRGHGQSLFDAAGEYARVAGVATVNPAAASSAGVPFGWPWEAGYFKPAADPVKNARRSGAMLAAGIDALLAEQHNPTKES